MAQNINALLQEFEAGGGQDEIYRVLLRATQMQNHQTLLQGHVLLPPLRPNLYKLPDDIVFPANLYELNALSGVQLDVILAAYQLPVVGTIAERRTRLTLLPIGGYNAPAEGQDGN